MELNVFAISVACFVTTFGGGLLGLWTRERILGLRQLTPETEEAVKLGVSIVATMTGLVLGLVMASAKSSFDNVEQAVRQAAARVITVDRALRELGEPVEEARAAWREGVDRLVSGLAGPSGAFDPRSNKPLRLLEEAATLAGSFEAPNMSKRDLQQRAISGIHDLLESGWFTLYSSGATMPIHFVGAVLAWLAFTFFCYGLVSPSTRVVIGVFLVSALSVAGSILLTLELELPFDGWLRVSWRPLLEARDFIFSR